MRIIIIAIAAAVLIAAKPVTPPPGTIIKPWHPVPPIGVPPTPRPVW